MSSRGRTRPIQASAPPTARQWPDRGQGVGEDVHVGRAKVVVAAVPDAARRAPLPVVTVMMLMSVIVMMMSGAKQNGAGDVHGESDDGFASAVGISRRIHAPVLDDVPQFLNH